MLYAVVQTDLMLYQYLGARRAHDPRDNFQAVCKDLVQYAKLAVTNRGIAALAAGVQELMFYLTRHMFEHELIWLLWWRDFGSTTAS